MTPTKKNRVLIAGDSALVRRALSHALAENPEIEVVGTAGSPYKARNKILGLNPDVLTLDIEMPLASRIKGAALARLNLDLSRFAPAPLGITLVAPGDFHMNAVWNGIGYQVLLNHPPLQHYARPAVDVLFDSAASYAQPNAVAALLTGMGTNGALGMQGLKTAGPRTIAHDESSSVVYGIPRASIKLGVADQILPLCGVPAALICAVSTRRGNGAQLTSSSHPAPAQNTPP